MQHQALQLILESIHPSSAHLPNACRQPFHDCISTLFHSAAVKTVDTRSHKHAHMHTHCTHAHVIAKHRQVSIHHNQYKHPPSHAIVMPIVAHFYLAQSCATVSVLSSSWGKLYSPLCCSATLTLHACMHGTGTRLASPCSRAFHLCNHVLCFAIAIADSAYFPKWFPTTSQACAGAPNSLYLAV